MAEIEIYTTPWCPYCWRAKRLLETKGARLDPRALRCASRLQVGQEPAPATLALVESVGVRQVVRPEQVVGDHQSRRGQVEG